MVKLINIYTALLVLSGTTLAGRKVNVAAGVVGMAGAAAGLAGAFMPADKADGAAKAAAVLGAGSAALALGSAAHDQYRKKPNQTPPRQQTWVDNKPKRANTIRSLLIDALN